MVINCYYFMTDSKDFDKKYKGLALKLLQLSRGIWPILWTNRALLDPGSGRAILCDKDVEEDGFRGAVSSLIGCVMQCSLRLFGQVAHTFFTSFVLDVSLVSQPGSRRNSSLVLGHDRAPHLLLAIPSKATNPACTFAIGNCPHRE